MRRSILSSEYLRDYAVGYFLSSLGSSNAFLGNAWLFDGYWRRDPMMLECYSPRSQCLLLSQLFRNSHAMANWIRSESTTEKLLVQGLNSKFQKAASK